MKTISYEEKVWKLRTEILETITEIMSEKKEVHIPFYYDTDVIDDDIETLIEDGFDVREGYESDNLYAELCSYCGYRSSIVVVGLTKNAMGEVWITSKDSNIHLLSDIYRIEDLAKIADFLTE
jgi:hypothetical protein